MRKKIMLLAAALVTGWWAFAAGLVFKVSADRPDCLYRCGEQTTFTVSACGAEGLALVTSGVANVRLDNFGTKIQVDRMVDLAKENPFTVSGTLDEPGFLRVTVSASDSPNVVFGVGYEPERIKPAMACPTDFDQFWANAIRKFDAEVPLDVQLTLAPEYCNDQVEVSRISFAICNNRRVYGYLSVPKTGKGSWPLRVTVPGAGWGWYSTQPPCPTDAIALFMTVFPFEPKKDWQAFLPEYNKWDRELAARYGVSRYCTSGIIVSREEYFYYPVILGINRAVDWAAARADVDKRQITYNGTSQGGGFGFFLLGLNKNFTRGAIFVPAITDHGGAALGRQSGWPQLLESQREESRAAAATNAPYFDGVNFAARITVPVRVVVGFADTTCSPSAVYAGYNVIPSTDKKIIHGIGMGHSVFGSFYEQIGNWEWQRP